MKKLVVMIIISGAVIGLFVVLLLGIIPGFHTSIIKRSQRLRIYLKDPASHTDWSITANTSCGSAPFSLPTDGMIGYLWDDSFYLRHRHTGIDIFGPTELGETPIYAAYDGYLTRMADWKSTVILRVPSDPINPEDQIWLYYTHMADKVGSSFIVDAFPLDTIDVFVKKGTLLGYQGNYSGNPSSPVGMHLHFSIVKSDSDGSFMNETKIENTLDPSPYFGISLRNENADSEVAICP
ncbi:MAG: M23 family metallopeptidase [Anaerolineaceae bacterium]|nr:M23 family metallopeptidase [Anaerolineaceae bacterium]